MFDLPPLDTTNSRLLFDGHRILDHQTANDLDLEDGDAIEVQLERESFSSPFFHSSSLSCTIADRCSVVDFITEVGGY